MACRLVVHGCVILGGRQRFGHRVQEEKCEGLLASPNCGNLVDSAPARPGESFDVDEGVHLPGISRPRVLTLTLTHADAIIDASLLPDQPRGSCVNHQLVIVVVIQYGVVEFESIVPFG